MAVLEPTDLQHHRAGPGRLSIVVVQDCPKEPPCGQSQERR